MTRAPVVRTYLELADPMQLRPAGEPRVAGDIEIARIDPPDGAVSAWFYRHVGAPHHWTDHLSRSAQDWQAWADQVETWIATVDGRNAGYYELRPDADAVEIAYFGLLADAQGQGLGGHLLTHALTRALELAPRAWLHTCTLDGPHALANYQARGLRPFHVETLGDA